MTIDELNILFEKEKSDAALAARSGADEPGGMSPVEKALERDYSLAKECFSSCSLEFFLFYSGRGLFDYILWSYEKKELLNVLNDHVASFHERSADAELKRMDADYDRAFIHKGDRDQTTIQKAGGKMTIDDLYRLYEEEKKELALPISYEGETLERFDVMEKALKSDYSLALECFSSCPLEFFLFFGNEVDGLFFDVLWKHRSEELLQTLSAHISSFHDREADSFLSKIDAGYAESLGKAKR